MDWSRAPTSTISGSIDGVNLILVEPGEISADGLLVLRDHRLNHLRSILRSAVGDTLRVGEVNGKLGTAEIRRLEEDRAELHVTLVIEAPPALPVTVVLALPRPKMLRRLLRAIAEFGVKELHLINSYRVEKSYWQSPLLAPDSIGRYLRAGLEQAMDTQVPVVELHRRFRPFAEDQLPRLLRERAGRLALPDAVQAYPAAPVDPSTLIIGPEGGFIPFETDLIIAAGAEAVHLGPRVLRVETALQAALGRHLAQDSQP